MARRSLARRPHAINHTENIRYNSWLAQIIFGYVIAMSSTLAIERHVLDTLRCGGKADFALSFVGMSEYCMVITITVIINYSFRVNILGKSELSVATKPTVLIMYKANVVNRQMELLRNQEDVQYLKKVLGNGKMKLYFRHTGRRPRGGES